MSDHGVFVDVLITGLVVYGFVRFVVVMRRDPGPLLTERNRASLEKMARPNRYWIAPAVILVAFFAYSLGSGQGNVAGAAGALSIIAAFVAGAAWLARWLLRR